ncbi:MAG: T9SS type A sorting domain-containing protein [Bacteroidota bacterium]
MKNFHFLPLLLSLLLSNLLSAQLCTSDNRFTEQEYFSDNQIDSRLNVRYGTAVDWLGNSVDLRMDVYFPKFNADPLDRRPFVLLIHGGGFKGGTKEAMTNYCLQFAKRGFVAATISYRLGWDQNDRGDQIYASYRAQQDANAALRFIARFANRARIDTDWLFIGGSSAGSVTSLNTIYMTQQDWETSVPGITALLGPLNSSGNNFNTTFELQGVFNNWGLTLDNGISPSEMVPSIAFHGVLDGVTPIGTGPSFPGGPINSGSGTIHNYLLSNNVCSELTVDSLGRHGIYRGNAGETFRVSRAACFFKSVFCDNCTSNYFTDSIPADCATTAPLTLNLDIKAAHPLPLRIFPNPADKVLNISGDLSVYDIELINTAGQIVRRIEHGSASTVMAVEDLTPGLYLLRLVNVLDQSIEVEKVLIQ